MPNPIPVTLTKDGIEYNFPTLKAAEFFIDWEIGIRNQGSLVRHYAKTGQKLRGFKIKLNTNEILVNS
jgi:hypothetical protein